MMANNLFVLGLRFILELGILASLGIWGWHASENWLRFLLALGLPTAAAVLWGIFRVPNDPGPATIAIPGILRLLLELALFGSAVWSVADLGWTILAWIFGFLIVLQNALSYSRIVRILKR